MEPAADKQAGFFASLRRLLTTGLAIAHNRLELLLVEAREQRLLALEAVFWVAAVAVCGFLALAMFTVAVLLLFGEEHRLAVVLVLGALYLLATIGAFLRLRHRLNHWPFFSASLDELKKDKACWEDKS